MTKKVVKFNKNKYSKEQAKMIFECNFPEYDVKSLIEEGNKLILEGTPAPGGANAQPDAKQQGLLQKLLGPLIQKISDIGKVDPKQFKDVPQEEQQEAIAQAQTNAATKLVKVLRFIVGSDDTSEAIQGIQTVSKENSTETAQAKQQQAQAEKEQAQGGDQQGGDQQAQGGDQQQVQEDEWDDFNDFLDSRPPREYEERRTLGGWLRETEFTEEDEESFREWVGIHEGDQYAEDERDMSWDFFSELWKAWANDNEKIIDEGLWDRTVAKAKSAWAGAKAVGNNVSNWAKGGGQEGKQSIWGAAQSEKFSGLLEQYIGKINNLIAKIQKYSNSTQDQEEQKKAEQMLTAMNGFVKQANQALAQAKEQLKKAGYNRKQAGKDGEQQQGQDGQGGDQGGNQGGDNNGGRNSGEKKGDRGGEQKKDNGGEQKKDGGDNKQQANESRKVTLTVKQLKQLVTETVNEMREPFYDFDYPEWLDEIVFSEDSLDDVVRAFENASWEVQTLGDGIRATSPSGKTEIEMHFGEDKILDPINDAFSVAKEGRPEEVDDIDNARQELISAFSNGSLVDEGVDYAVVYHVTNINWDVPENGDTPTDVPGELYIGSDEEMTEDEIEQWLEEHYYPVSYDAGTPFDYEAVDPESVDPGLIEEGWFGDKLKAAGQFVGGVAKGIGQAAKQGAQNAIATAQGAAQEIGDKLKDRAGNYAAGKGFTATVNCQTLAKELSEIIGEMEADLKDCGWSEKQNPSLAKVIDQLEQSANEVHGQGAKGTMSNLAKIRHGIGKMAGAAIQGAVLGAALGGLTAPLKQFMSPRMHAALVAASIVLLRAVLRNIAQRDIKLDKQEEAAAQQALQQAEAGQGAQGGQQAAAPAQGGAAPAPQQQQQPVQESRRSVELTSGQLKMMGF